MAGYETNKGKGKTGLPTAGLLSPEWFENLPHCRITSRGAGQVLGVGSIRKGRSYLDVLGAPRLPAFPGAAASSAWLARKRSRLLFCCKPVGILVYIICDLLHYVLRLQEEEAV